LLTHEETLTFADFPFSESLRRDLAAAGYVAPTPIQARVIGPALEGQDIIGLAQTGTGKTGAFALPLIHRLGQKMELGALVLAPTRELVKQIVEVFKMLGRSSGTRVASVVGGVKFDLDLKALRSWPSILVATPGRLLDHMEQKTVDLRHIETLVIDEADRMHDMGFIPQIRRIIAGLPTQRQTLMFTATMPRDVEEVARRNMRQAVKILVGPASQPVERAEQRLYRVDETAKVPLLLDLLRREKGRVLVFLRTKRGVDRLARRVTGRRTDVARIHGDREQSQRDTAMEGFREGKYRVLIATDIAARGLDVADIEHVINYDFPRSPEDYVHRIGRTARLVATGRATSFVTPADRKYVADLERLLGSKLTLTPAPLFAAHTPSQPAPGHPPRVRTGPAAHGHPATPARASHGHHAAPAHASQGHHAGQAHAAQGHQAAPAHAAQGHHAAPDARQAGPADAPGGSPRRRRRRGGRGRERSTIGSPAAVKSAACGVGAPAACADGSPAATRRAPPPAAVEPAALAEPKHDPHTHDRPKGHKPSESDDNWPAIAEFGFQMAE
jgi:ATP-dependent RNA helicase RhlE